MNPGAQSLTCLFRDINFGHSFSRFQNGLTCMSRSFNLKVIRDPNSGFVRQNVMLRDHVYRAQTPNTSMWDCLRIVYLEIEMLNCSTLRYILFFLTHPGITILLIRSIVQSPQSMVGNPSIHHIFIGLSQ